MRRLVLPFCLALLLAALAPAGAVAQAPGATPPTATTLSASPVGASTATVRGRVDANGQPTSYRFEYGTTASYGLQTADDSAGLGTDPVGVSASLTGLTPDTTYHFRVIAWPDSDPSATAVGGDRTFRTIAPPDVGSNSPRGTTPNGTTLDGKVDPNGSPTEVHFEWGVTRDYGQPTPGMNVGGGRSRLEVQALIGGLTPHATYHYRIVATNAAGTRRGGDRAFTTTRQPTAITLTASTPIVGFGGTATIDGQVQGAGVDRIPLRLETTPFPFTAPFATSGDAVRAAANGSFHLVTRPLQISTRLHVVTATDPPVVSPELSVLSRLIVGATASRRGARNFRITGAVTPRISGARVIVQRRVGRKWRAAKRTRTKRVGRLIGYTVTVRQRPKVGRYRALVKPRTKAYAPSASRSVIVPKRTR